MATDINEELGNIYNQARMAINDDLKTQFHNAAQTRNQAFRQLNNNANARHALYSGMPAATQMQYDQNTYLPGIATMTANAIARQQNNQEQWDNYMDYINELNEQANYYNGLASDAQSQYNDLNSMVTSNGGSNAAGGLTEKPTSPSTSTGNSAYQSFASGGGSW